MENKSKVRIIQYIILLICVAVFLVCGVFLIQNILGYMRADSFYDKMTIDSKPSSDVQAIPERVETLFASYTALKQEYPNIVGYINIPSVSISYPVVQGEDNEYYTTHLISGEENKSGSIFLDCFVNTSPSVAKNLILYGHNMNDKTMFHNLRDLFDEEIFRQTQVEYICDEGVFLYDSLSVYVTDTSDIYYAHAFYNDEVFSEFFEERASLSWFSAEYETPSNIITLVTCSNSSTKPNQRFLYHGKLVKSYTNFGGDS